tara:strand:+ start:55 stop:285 length:231 start_codon:yes stop_codon:yes gene_type:complete
MKNKYIQVHPNETKINDSCTIEILRADDKDGYDMLIFDEEENAIIQEWEPDFEWAWLTAKYYSLKHNLEIFDRTPY